VTAAASARDLYWKALEIRRGHETCANGSSGFLPSCQGWGERGARKRTRCGTLRAAGIASS